MVCKGLVREFTVLLGVMEGGGNGWQSRGVTFMRDLAFWTREFRLSSEAMSIGHFDVLNGIGLPENDGSKRGSNLNQRLVVA